MMDAAGGRTQGDSSCKNVEAFGQRAANATGDALCKHGFAGPLCAACKDHHFLSKASQECVDCTEDGGFSKPETILALSILIIVVGLGLRHLHQRKGQPSVKTGQSMVQFGDENAQ